MNALLTAVILAVSTTLALAEDPPASPPSVPAPPAAPAPAPAPADVATETVPTPLVRMPAPPSLLPAEATAPAGAPVKAAAPVVEEKPGAALAGGGELSWKADGVTLRQPAAAASTITLRTNRSLESGGSLPRLVKPERRTFGGFMAGFANLFNPFAPTSQGVAASQANWYDAQPNVAPLPRAFRDERTHEASAILFSTEIDGEPRKAEAAPAKTPAK